MPNQGDFDRVEPSTPVSTSTGFGAEPGIPQGTNAGLLSTSSMPMTSDTGMSTSGIVGRVTNIVDSGKAKLAGSLHDLGDRIEHTGRNLEMGNFLARPLGRALDSTGDVLESGARYLRTRDIDVIGDDVVDGIRAHPLVTAGVAVGCGWLLGRMFGSGDEREEESVPVREDSHEHDEEEEPEHFEAGSSMMDRLRGKVSDLVAGGIAAYAARQVRDRIAGR